MVLAAALRASAQAAAMTLVATRLVLGEIQGRMGRSQRRRRAIRARCHGHDVALRWGPAAMAVTLTPILDIPMVRPGDDLAGLMIAACERNALAPADGDVLVVAQKIVSKAEGRYVDLAKVKPSPRAVHLAAEVSKDPRLVEVILAESRRVVRQRPGVLIVEHRLGFIMANAGVDRSNIDPDVAAEPVLLLPSDPDASAAGLCARLAAHFRTRPGVIVTDSWGRACPSAPAVRRRRARRRRCRAATRAPSCR